MSDNSSYLSIKDNLRLLTEDGAFPPRSTLPRVATGEPIELDAAPVSCSHCGAPAEGTACRYCGTKAHWTVELAPGRPVHG